MIKAQVDTNLAGWDWMLNLIPYAGPAIFGAKKIYDKYGKDDKGGTPTPSINVSDIVRKYDPLTSGKTYDIPWYQKPVNYIWIAAGVVGVAVVVRLVRR